MRHTQTDDVQRLSHEGRMEQRRREEYITIYIYVYIEVGMLGQRHGFMNGGPRKKQAVGQLVPVDSDNCVARAGIRGQNESTLAC